MYLVLVVQIIQINNDLLVKLTFSYIDLRREIGLTAGGYMYNLKFTSRGFGLWGDRNTANFDELTNNQI